MKHQNYFLLEANFSLSLTAGSMQLKSGHQRRRPPPPPTLFYGTQNDKTEKKNGTMTTGHIISLQVNNSRTKCFTSAAAFLYISMTMCGQCFNAAQLTAPERGWRPQHWAVLPGQMSPHVVQTIRGGVPHLTNHTPNLPSVCLTAQRRSTPSKPVPWRPAFPHTAHMTSHSAAPSKDERPKAPSSFMAHLIFKYLDFYLYIFTWGAQ